MKHVAGILIGALTVWSIVVLDRATGASTKFLSAVGVTPKA